MNEITNMPKFIHFINLVNDRVETVQIPLAILHSSDVPILRNPEANSFEMQAIIT